MLRQAQLRIRGHQPVHRLGGLLQQPGVRVDIPHPKREFPALPDAEQLPRPSELQILRGDMEAVIGLVQNFQPFHGFRLLVRADEDAVALVLPAAHPPPELMKLGQAEALRVLHHHHSGVGHIDPHLYDRGGHQYIDGMLRELVHDAVLVPGAHPAVEIGHPDIGGQRTFKRLRVVHHILHGNPALGVIRVPLHLGTDDIDLPPLGHLSGDEPVGFGPVAGIHHAVLDGQPVRGQLVDDRQMEVPV